MNENAVRTNLSRAIDAMRAGHMDAAAQALEADGGAALKTPVGQNIRGDILLKQGRGPEALKAFDAAVRMAPSAPQGYCNRGVALQSLGRFDEALTALDRALRYRPDYATAHFNRGNVLKALGRIDEAIAAYGRALGSRPAYVGALVNRGTALLAEGKALEALRDFGRALGLKPDLVEAHLGRASAHRDLAQYDLALAEVVVAQKAEPDNLEAARLRYRILLAAERGEEALAWVDALLARNPEDATTYCDRAAVLLKLGRLAAALDAAEESIRLRRDESASHVVRGQILDELGRLEESLAALDEAARLGAAGHVFFNTRAIVRATVGDSAAALADFATALALQPDNAETRYNRAFLWLALGNWRQGWPEYEWRLSDPRYAPPHIVRHIAAWQGEPLAGKHLLVHTEQGHGDTFQFVRYLNLIDHAGGEVTLLCRDAVRRLLADAFPGISVTDNLRPGFDYQVSLMSLPAIWGTTLETVPAAVPYLAAGAERVAKWAARVGDRGFRVGIVWQGSRAYTRDRDRSVPLTAFAPLASVPGVRLISVQAMVGLEQLDALPAGMVVERLGAEIENNPDGFREMAAVMANLDLLIMSDTGPTHLAGALGRPVWMATSRHPDWRWMREREDSPWYPTMRLFRQETAGDWDGVFARIAQELAQRVRESGRAG